MDEPREGPQTGKAMNRRLLIGLFVVPLACGNSGSNTESGSGGSPGATGGTTGSGGKTGTTGGAPGTAGRTGSGGAVTTGSGGSNGTGGANTTGGTTGAGGNTGTGGVTATGGKTGTGGATATGGATGTGGVTATGGKGGAGASGTGGDSSQSVLERNKHPNRDGSFVQPTLTKAKAATMSADTTFNAGATFTGTVYGSPLYLQNGPSGKGVYFAVTTGNDVYALDETSGATVWHHNIGSSPTMNQSGSPTCGSIHPLGIISTPVINASTTPPTIYVAGAIGTTSIMSHQVHALSTTDGSEISGWPVDVSNATSGNVTFATPYQNQRSALSLVNGTLYVAYGGHIGDCGPYHGWVIGINTQNPVMRGAWATAGQGEAIWPSGGMASDGNGVFAVTGNNTAGTTSHMDSEELVRITGLGTSSDSFYPTNWHAMDMNDADLSANSPLYIEVPGATPSKMVVAIAKDGHMYLLDAANLGGMGGQKVDFQVAGSVGGEGMLVHTAPASYMTSQGMHVVFSTDSSANCPASGASGAVVMSVLIPAGAPPKPQVVWCAAASNTPGPISTTTDGTNEVVVWFMNNGKLTGVDGDTGTSIYTSSNTCSGVQHWTSPIAANGHIVAVGSGHVCSWSAP